MQPIFDTLAFLRRWVQALGPYLMLELLLPGGTLLALTFFLYRSGRLGIGPAARNPRYLPGNVDFGCRQTTMSTNERLEAH